MTSAPVRPSETRPTTWWLVLVETAAEAIRPILGVIVLIGGGSWFHGHFAAKAALCQSLLGQLAQEQDSGTSRHCTTTTVLADVGSAARWIGIVAAVGLAVVALFVLNAWAAERQA